MQKFVSKCGLAAHLALLAVAPLFLFPFFGESVVARVLLWLSAGAAIWVLLEPSRRSGELLHDARSRVASEIVRDPLFWASLVLVVMTGVRWANGGIAIAYNAETSVWYMKEPAMAFFPGCVTASGGLPFAASVALLVLLQGCRHALGKTARAYFLVASSLLAGTAALVAIATGMAGYAGSMEFMECSLATSSYPGMAFGLHFLGGIAGLVAGFERRWNRYTLLFSVAIGGCASGLYFFAPTFTVLVFTAAGALVLAYSLVFAGFTIGSVDACKCMVAVLIAMALPVLCAMGAGGGGVNGARLAFIDGAGFFPEKYGPLGDLLSSISQKVWKVHPWLGSGVGSFPLDVRFNATRADWAILPHGQSAALNGWWLLLSERGIIGALSFAVIAGFLLFTFVRRLVSAFGLRFYHPACVLGVVAVAAAGVDSAFSASFLRPESLMAVAAFFALAASAFPARRRAQDADKEPQQQDIQSNNNG